MSEDTVQQREYKIFLSCEDDLIINNEHIEELLKKHVRRTKNVNIDIKCTKRRENVKSAIQDLKNVEGNCVYVIDIQRDLDNTAYCQLGYAIGRNMKIIGYYAGKKKDKKISEDLDQLTGQFHSDDDKHFLELISAHITSTMGVIFSDWDPQHDISKTEEPEAR